MGLDERYHQEWKNISRYVRELFTYHCASCGKDCRSPSNQEDLLHVHHIDENPGNNDLENLIPLCAVCHLRIEKEARLHAPFHNRQTELFVETYHTAMQSMRKNAVEHYAGLQKSLTADMSPEEYESFVQERDWDQ
ncbi:MAG: HNH endonuclease [SAR324 cluster bacterium]|nr:HNH endonuclease [SAR324 cluster bacterium]